MLALTSQTSGGRSVGTVRSRTQTTEVFVFQNRSYKRTKLKELWSCGIFGHCSPAKIYYVSKERRLHFQSRNVRKRPASSKRFANGTEPMYTCGVFAICTPGSYPTPVPEKGQVYGFQTDFLWLLSASCWLFMLFAFNPEDWNDMLTWNVCYFCRCGSLKSGIVKLANPISGYRSRGPGSIPSATWFSEKQWSGTVPTQPREYNWGANWRKSSGSSL
jgi:hypothetical protein